MNYQLEFLCFLLFILFPIFNCMKWESKRLKGETSQQKSNKTLTKIKEEDQFSQKYRLKRIKVKESSIDLQRINNCKSCSCRDCSKAELSTSNTENENNCKICQCSQCNESQNKIKRLSFKASRKKGDYFDFFKNLFGGSDQNDDVTPHQINPYDISQKNNIQRLNGDLDGNPNPDRIYNDDDRSQTVNSVYLKPLNGDMDIPKDPSLDIYENIRIKIDSSFLKNERIFKTKNEYLQFLDIIKVALRIIKNWLEVKGINKSSPIVIPQYMECFGENKKFTEVNKAITDYDFILYLDAEYRNQESYIAYATTCMNGSPMQGYRPLAGLFAINTFEFKLKDSSFEENISTSIHEIFHSLGFSKGQFKNFVDPETNKLLGIENVVKSIHYDSSKHRDTNIVITKTVAKLTRKYFNCNSIKGLLLENEGSAGTYGSHWERRILMNEGMTGSDLANSLFSQFTLALLGDSGWYKVNQLNSPKRLLWGFNAGCDFYNYGCNMNNREEDKIFNDHFCTNKGESGCTNDKSAVGVCNSDSLSDGCKYFRNDLKTVCSTNPTERILQQDSDFKLGMKFGANSKCFESNAQLSGIIIESDQYARCHEFKCVFDQNKIIGIHIKIGLFDYECYEKNKGQYFPLKQYQGYGDQLQGGLICPTDFSKYCHNDYLNCADLDYCNKNGVCLYDRCECFQGKKGPTCI